MPTDATGTPTSLGIPTLNVDVDEPSGLGFNEAMVIIDSLLVSRSGVSSFVGRTGNVTANSGDYTAAKVTNAADVSNVGGNTFLGPITVNNTSGLSVFNGSGFSFRTFLVGTDANPAFSVFKDGTQSWGLGGVNPVDTTVARSAPGQLTIGGTAGKGNIVGGGASNNAGGPATLTPDAAALFNRYNFINASGTFTIAAPSNPPGANQSGLLIIVLHNASGGAVTVTWNAVYNSNPATPPNGLGAIALFAWNPGTSKWNLVSSQVSIND